MPVGSFTAAQEAAWDWIRAAVDEGVTVSAALADYRASGNSIRTQDWYRAYKSISEAGDTWQTLRRFRPNETIPESAWLDAPRDFANKYVAEVHFQIRNLGTGDLNSVYRYIESDYRMSKQEIDNALADMVDEISTTDPTLVSEEGGNVEFIYGYKFYKKG